MVESPTGRKITNILRIMTIEEVFSKSKNKRLLVVYPHPDDEVVMAGGLIIKAIEAGFWVTVLTLTEGDKGKIFIHGRGRSLAEIRASEQAEAMSRLGVADWIMWKFPDGKLRRQNGWRKRLREFVTETDPGLVVTYDLSGVSGHPDHISLSVELLRIVRQLQEVSLLWTSFKGESVRRLVSRRVRRYLQRPHLELSLTYGQSWIKWTAVFSHKSQNLRSFLKRSKWWLVWQSKTEWYSLPDLSKKHRYRYISFNI